MDSLIGQSATAGDLIRDGSERSFAADVLEASREVAVIVDFWATWCGPCKTLGPALERAVTAAKGKVKLVKIDVDKNQNIARQLRIQSIPSVYAFKDGQPVDGFVGALPDSQVNSFVQRLAGLAGASPIDDILAAGREALEANDLQAAAQAFHTAIEDDSLNPKALAGLAKVYIAANEIDRARQTLDLVPPEGRKDPEFVSAHAALSLKEQSGSVGETAGLEARLASNPNDHEARFELSLALAGSGKREEAVDHLLDLIKRDKKWNDEAARKQLVKLFEAFGPTDPLTVSARKRLSSLLFA